MNRTLRRLIPAYLFALSLTACSGGGTGLGSSSALPPASPNMPPVDAAATPAPQVTATPASDATAIPAPDATATPAADLSVAASAQALRLGLRTTIHGTILNNAAPQTHVLVLLASKRQLTVYTSLLRAAKIGDPVAATGYLNSKGNFQASTAHILRGTEPTPSPGPSDTPAPPSPAPSGMPTERPTPAPSSAGTLGKIGLLQVFDYNMTSEQATAAAAKYRVVWGSGIGGRGASARAWQAGNAKLINARYFVQGTDVYGLSGHDLVWWQANHPDWIVYDCNRGNQPTHTVAFQPGLPANVPLDITNPEVIKYQVRLAGTAAIQFGNNAIAADQTLFFDYDGGQHQGWFGCGTYASNGGFVRRWGADRAGFPNFDPQWKHDTAAWVRSAKRIIATDPMLASHHLKLMVNHPAGNLNDPDEQTLLGNVDANLDETGFTGYGSYTRTPGLFKVALDYMQYAQAHGTTILLIDKFSGGNQGGGNGGRLSASQLSWTIGTYLMGNEGAAALFVTPGDGYGSEQYHAEYASVDAKMGLPCGAYYSTSTRMYYRKFHGGLVVVNSGGAGTLSAHLPQHSYTDLTGRQVTNPLAIPSADAYVLFTNANGCS
ncbi:MAG: hypothetical protein GIW98_04235 [Candidatus Eremiobacteraeota bacterium]|nr:hypothetical protein [Candidatus Eremiobacteraeota bacterium]